MSQDWKEKVLAELSAELEAMETAGKAPKDIAELEQITINMTRKLGKKVIESWTVARAQDTTFSP
jgi:hypothetical protein